MLKVKSILVGAGLAAAVLGADQLCKAYARKQSGVFLRDKQVQKPGHKPAVRITYAENRGFALNRGEKHPLLVKGASLAAVTACLAAFLPVIRSGTAAQAAGISFLLGGGLSNTCDRFTRGKVTDYIGVGKVVYNLADFAVFAGMLMLVIPACRAD